MYSISEVANELGKHPETVRRWIRDGKLKAECNSRKDGYLISEEEYKKLVDRKSKKTIRPTESLNYYENRLKEISKIEKGLQIEKEAIIQIIETLR